MIPERYPYKVGYEWAPPYRFNRIRSMIESSRDTHNKLTLANMEFLQNDVKSLSALEFQRLISSTSLSGDPTLHSFLDWNEQLTRDSSEAVLYEVWFQQICYALGTRFSREHSGRYSDLEPNTVLRLLTNPDKDLFGDNPAASRDRLLVDSLRSARQDLAKLLGPDASKWSWGKLHTVHFRHAVDQQAEVKELFDLGPLARPGDEYTVNATGTYGDSWEQVSGASYREILDTSNWDQSVAVNTPGQSGQPGSPHYSDLMPLWDAGRYFPLLYSMNAVERETTNRLVLEP
jgi:penicillin amidase